MRAPPAAGDRARGALSFHGWRIVGVLALTETVSWGVLYYAFAVVQVPMRAELGLSTATVAGAFSLAVLVTGITAVPVGRWLDRYGGRALMTSGSVAAVLLVLAWSRVQDALGLYVVFAGIGVASAAVLYEPAFAVVVRWFVRGRSGALLAVTVAGGLASTIFLPLTDALVRDHGWRQALVVLAGLLAVTTVLPHALVLRRDPADLGTGPDGEVRGAGSDRVPGTYVHDVQRRPSLRATARWAAGERPLVLLTLAFAANALAVAVVVVSLVPYLLERGHSGAFAATATGALGALSVTGRVVLTGAARRWGTASVTALAFAMQAVGVVVLLGWGASSAGALVFVLLFGLGFGVGTIARPALLADGYGAARYATLSALSGVALTVARTLGPVAAGLTRTATGSYQPVLLGLVLVCAASALALARSGALLPGRITSAVR